MQPSSPSAKSFIWDEETSHLSRAKNDIQTDSFSFPNTVDLIDILRFCHQEALWLMFNYFYLPVNIYNSVKVHILFYYFKVERGNNLTLKAKIQSPHQNSVIEI